MTEREQVRAFFAELEPSERLRLFEFFSHQVGYVPRSVEELEPLMGDGGGLDPVEMVKKARFGTDW